MATYSELRGLFDDSALRNRVAVAIAIAANKVMTGTDNAAPFSQIAGAHDLRVAWAKGILGRAESAVPQFWQNLLAANNAATVATIQSASDAVLQASVDAAVDLFAGVAV